MNKTYTWGIDGVLVARTTVASSNTAGNAFMNLMGEYREAADLLCATGECENPALEWSDSNLGSVVEWIGEK